MKDLIYILVPGLILAGLIMAGIAYLFIDKKKKLVEITVYGMRYIIEIPANCKEYYIILHEDMKSFDIEANGRITKYLIKNNEKNIN